MKKIILSAVLFSCTLGVFAEGELDVIRYSGTDLNGTARGIAMGGAFGALGGDVTGITINPASLGVYRSSEINASLNLSSANTKTELNGEYASKFNFDNVSYVGYFPTYGDNPTAFNFSVSYNRIKSFDRNYQTAAASPASVTDYMVQQLFGHKVGNIDYQNTPWLGTLGYEAYIINPVDPSSGQDPKDVNQYVSMFPEGELKHRLNVSEKGDISSWDFSFGANFSDQFYLGATISLTEITYSYLSTYDEDADGGGFTLKNSFETEGSGLQLKIGAIYRPFDALRLGIAYHSPTWYSMTNYYSGSIDAKYSPANVDDFANTPSDGYTNYNLKTPSVWTFSAATVLGRKAILSLDYEIKNYQGMRLSRDDNDYSYYADVNNWVKDDFKLTSTLRAGGEYRFTQQFSGRLGYAWSQNPYSTTFASNPTAYDLQGEYKDLIPGTVPHFTISGDTQYFTAGIGYKFTPQCYADLAFVVRSQTDDLYYFPSFEAEENGRIEKLVKSNTIALHNITYKGLLTVGYKF
ncbi:hemin receptor [Bacteroidia bacterium]|nr:hemin receptor [Bacteroidia bacterium]